ncbi:MAG: ABC transporter permease [Acetobacteraceae bacterium]|nr:ABC transporter permease [Acetobacteraceae bacterium]
MRGVALTRLGVIAAFIALLEALCRFGIVKPLTLVAPSRMVGTLIDLIQAGDVGDDAARTAIEVAGAFVLAILLGVSIGAVIHAIPRLRRAVAPVLVSWYAVPSFVFYPLFIALLGLSEAPLIAIGAFSATPAMVVATISGLDRVPRVLRRVARVHRMGFWDTLRHITLPSALPSLFTGVKLAFAYAFIGVIAGEFILSGGGLGYAIAYAYESFETAKMYALMLLVLGVGVAVNAGLHTWEGRLLRRRQR